MVTKKKILVIGGGFSGIAAIKSLKEEGHEPVCYEKTANPGGTWYYREETPVGIPSIMPTTILNHSKEIGTLSNFVPDKSVPNYMRHTDQFKMFMQVGERFDCFRHITFNREVIQVKRAADYTETGRWDATVKSTETGEIMEEAYDGVMVAVGHFTHPMMAEYPCMDKYKGKIMHSHSLKGVEEFKGKRVLVIGIGCSGLDAAVGISDVSSQVYLSTRSGTWILPRIGPHGLPLDYISFRRHKSIIQSAVGYKIASWYLEKYWLNKKFDHNLYNLKPAYHALSKDPAINDLIPFKLVSGTVVMRKGVKCFTERGVIFEDETQVTEVDAVIMATGYRWQFPFLEDGIICAENGRIDLYHCVYPPQLQHPTLAIIGFLLPFGPGLPLAEMQCRWVSQVFSDKCKLPSLDIMMASINKRFKSNLKRYAPSEKISIRVDYIHYMDLVAAEIGVKPNMWKILFTDPTLFKALAFGPSLPYQYRLEGPHKWIGARKAILTVHGRICYPLSGDEKSSVKSRFNTITYAKYAIILVALWFAQRESSMKSLFLALMFLYLMKSKGMKKKYFFSLLMLPLFMTCDGLLSYYIMTILTPLLLAFITSI